MVQFQEDPPSQEPIEELDQNGQLITDRNDFMSFLREQLEDILPSHDKKQDDFLLKLKNVIFLPENADDAAKKIFEELCVKQEELLQLQKERIELTASIRSYYNLQRAGVTQQQCRLEVDTLFIGKQNFFVVSKHLEELLYKLHGRERL